MKMFCCLSWIFLPFELTQEILYIFESFVRFPCQMTKRFIFAFAILMWKKNKFAISIVNNSGLFLRGTLAD